MRNKFALLLALSLLVAVALGCGMLPRGGSSGSGSNTGSNKTLTDKGVDTVVGEEKIGVTECDEVMDMLTAYANNPDDNFVTKAVKATFINKIKEGIRKAVEESKNNNKNGGTAELAKTCKDFKTQLEKYKAEEEAKQKQ